MYKRRIDAFRFSERKSETLILIASAIVHDKNLPHNDAVSLLEDRITNATGHMDRNLGIRLLGKG